MFPPRPPYVPSINFSASYDLTTSYPRNDFAFTSTGNLYHNSLSLSCHKAPSSTCKSPISFAYPSSSTLTSLSTILATTRATTTPKMKRMYPSLLYLLLFLLVSPLVHCIPTSYNLEDLSSISLYSSAARYNPSPCPTHITFSERAIYNPQLHKLVLPSSSFHAEGISCKSDIPHLIFKPIGSTTHYPPQWLFEDSTYMQRAINFTCGQHQFSIRFGYFNDVDTAATRGILNPNVMYFDFAVFPYTTPFSYCSYAGRRKDGNRPIDFAPFPTSETWQTASSKPTTRSSMLPPTPSMPNVGPPVRPSV